MKTPANRNQLCMSLICGLTFALPFAASADDRETFERVTSEIEEELEMKFSDPNDPRLHERRKRLRELFREIPRPYAARFATAMEHEDRALCELFRYKLATATRNEMLGILKTPTAEEESRFEEVKAELRSELAGLDADDPDLDSSVDRLRILIWDIPGSLEHKFLEESIIGASEIGKLYEEKVGALDEEAQGEIGTAILNDWNEAATEIDEVLPTR